MAIQGVPLLYKVSVDGDGPTITVGTRYPVTIIGCANVWGSATVTLYVRGADLTDINFDVLGVDSSTIIGISETVLLGISDTVTPTGWVALPTAYTDDFVIQDFLLSPGVQIKATISGATGTTDSITVVMG